jgi:CRISPR-associated protein Csm5
LKGALRTGLVFSRWSAATMERVASSLERDRVPRRTAEAAELQAGASQTKIVSAADSNPVAPSVFKIYLTRVASLDTRQSGKPQLAWKIAGRGSVPHQRVNDSTPVFTEMAVPGTSFDGEWRLERFFENEEVARALGWRSVPTVKMLTDAANQYAAAQLQIHAQYAQTTGMAALQATIQQLQQRLEEAQSAASTCLLCLGWGSGFISKAGFLDTENAAYRTILRAVPPIAKAIREGVPFPKTRRVVFSAGQPAYLPGWAAVRFEDS